jgi:uncharacterized protein
MKERCRHIVFKALAVVRPQFRLDLAGGIHGLPHWSRVWFHGRALAMAADVDPAVLAWFAFLHDSQRRNDGHDPLHGRRAADFAVRLREDGVITELDRSAFEHLCEAMRLHSDGHTVGDAAVQACWDADRLDLGRVGVRPHRSRLCTPHAQRDHVIRMAVRMSEGQARSPRRRAVP